MEKIRYIHVFYTTVFIFMFLFIFLNNDWVHRTALFILACTVFGVIKYSPPKWTAFIIIFVFVLFKIIDMVIISK